MNLLFHDHSFDKEMLVKFFEAVNTTPEEQVITIYLSSDGGLVSVLNAMLFAINRQPERFNIIGYDELCSAAFQFFIKANCEKTLLPGCIGMHHQTTSKIFIDDTGKPAYYDGEAYLKRKKKTFFPELKQFMKDCGFTEKEKKKIIKGDDVYFQYDRMLEIQEAYSRKKNKSLA